VALNGIHSEDGWLTRMRADLPTQMLSVDLRLAAAASQTPVSSYYRTSELTARTLSLEDELAVVHVVVRERTAEPSVRCVGVCERRAPLRVVTLPSSTLIARRNRSPAEMEIQAEPCSADTFGPSGNRCEAADHHPSRRRRRRRRRSAAPDRRSEICWPTHWLRQTMSV